MRAGENMIELLMSLVALEIDFLKEVPGATILILILSIALNLVSAYAARRSMNVEDYKRVMTESKYVQAELMDAMKTDNKRRITRAQKRQQEVQQETLKISSSRMKTQTLILLPLLLIWPALSNFLGNIVVARIPFNAPFFGTRLPWVNWYVLCSLASNTIVQRVFGLTFEIEPRTPT